ncbi:MAG: hypothetical protein AAF485_06345 [Chloroflexota bacterium]
MLQVGDKAPVIPSLDQDDGNSLTAAQLEGKSYVLWFYPKASTGG